MSTIGKVTLDLEARHAAFSKGISESRKDLSNLAETAQSVAETIKTAIEVAAVAEGVNVLREWSAEVLESAITNQHLADSLGISAGAMSSLSGAAKLSHINTEALQGALQKLTKNLGEAEAGFAEGVEALASVGLAAKDLKGLNLDQTFTLIAQRISGISDPAARARAEVELFGKSGQQLDPLLRQGAAGIEEARKKAAELGIALSDVDSAKLVAAQERLEEVNLAFEGIKNQAIVALAPVLGEIASDVMKIVPPAETMRSAFLSGFRDVAVAVGYVVDGYNDLKGVVLAMAAVGTGAVEGILIAFEKLAEAIVWVKNKVTGGSTEVPGWMKGAVEGADILRKQFADDATAAFNAPSAHKAAAEFFDNIQKKSAETAAAVASAHPAQVLADGFEDSGKKVSGILDRMKKEVAEFGMSKGEKQIADVIGAGGGVKDVAQATWLAIQMAVQTNGQEAAKKSAEAQKKVKDELERMSKEVQQSGMSDGQKQLDDLKRGGATDEQIGQAKQMADQLDAAKAYKKSQEEAKKIIEDSMTPLQKYQENLKHLMELRHDGLLDQQQYAQAVEKANKEREKKDKVHDKTDTLERRFDFRLPTPKRDPNDPAHLQLKEAKEHTRSLRQIAKNSGKKPRVASI